MDAKLLEKRFVVVTIVIVLTFIILASRLFYIQIVAGHKYQKLSEENSIQIVPIPAPRGEFRDTKGRLLVTNRPGFTVSYLDINKDEATRRRVLDQIRKILNINEYVVVAEETHKVNQKGQIRIDKLPVVDLNDDGEIDRRDIIVKDEKGRKIEVKDFETYSGTATLAVREGRKVLVTYRYDPLEHKIRAQGYKKYIPVRLKRDVSFETVAKIEEKKLPGVIIEVQPIRNYIYGYTAAHVFGYLGEISRKELEKFDNYRVGDFIGKTGLEKVLEPYLKGKDGGKQVEVTATGEFVKVLGEKRALPGHTVYLTIDVEIQKAAENALMGIMNKLRNNPDPTNRFPNAKEGAVVVMDVNTGEILALVSKPDFDPNLFASGISLKEWEQLNSDPEKPLLNKAIGGSYPPGSIFKMVVACAALEEGVTTPDLEIDTNGGVYWTIAPKKCWYYSKGGHGIVNLVEAIAKSCNIYFYEMGRRLGIDAIEKYARMFQLDKKTGIELPGEKSGSVPSRDYKEKNFKNPQDKIWYPAETLDAAIGQGFHSYTPLQIAKYVSAIANGGKLYKPFLVKKIVSPEGKVVEKKQPQLVGRLNLKKETLETVKRGMKAVVEPGGTAWWPFRDFPIQVAGKTGTAQWSILYDNHGWFVSFAPYDNPQIAVIVFIEQAGSGGSTGGPVARAIYEKYFNLDQKEEIRDYFTQP